MEHDPNIRAPGVYLLTGNKIQLVAAGNVDGGELGVFVFNLTATQATGLGMSLLALAAAEEETVRAAAAKQQAELAKPSDVAFLKAAGVSLQ